MKSVLNAPVLMRVNLFQMQGYLKQEAQLILGLIFVMGDLFDALVLEIWFDLIWESDESDSLITN